MLLPLVCVDFSVIQDPDSVYVFSASVFIIFVLVLFKLSDRAE